MLCREVEVQQEGEVAEHFSSVKVGWCWQLRFGIFVFLCNATDIKCLVHRSQEKSKGGEGEWEQFKGVPCC